MLHLVHEASSMSSLLSLRTSLIPLAGVLHMVLGGVTLHLDVEAEDSYMDLAPGFSKKVAVIVTKELPQLGFEVMDEFDGAEDLPDGTIRKYLAQTWFPDVEAVNGMVQAS